MMRIIILFLLLALVYTNKVHIQNIQVITLQQGAYTTGRRTNSIPQLKCVGGSASWYANVVTTMQCQNMGFDGIDVNWKCDANIPTQYQLGRVKVLCEGYDYPEDPFILAGSCGVEFELNRNPNYVGPRTTTTTTWWDPTTDLYYNTYYHYDDNLLVNVLVVCFLLSSFVVILACCIGTTSSVSSTQRIHVMPEPVYVYRPWYYPSFYSGGPVPVHRHTHTDSSTSSTHQSSQYANTERR